MLDTNSPYIEAASEAIREAWGVKQVRLIREGGSIPVVQTFKDVLGLDTLLLGWGQNTDNLHSPNEHFSMVDFHAEFERCGTVAKTGRNATLTDMDLDLIDSEQTPNPGTDIKRSQGTSGRYLVVGLLLFGSAATGLMFVYWEQHTRPFRLRSRSDRTRVPSFASQRRRRTVKGRGPWTLRIRYRWIFRLAKIPACKSRDRCSGL